MVLTTDIATQLVTDSVGTIVTEGEDGTADWSIYQNNMRSSPDRCIAVFAYGGIAPSTSWAGEFPSVQVRVRGNKDDHATTYAKAYAVMNSLHELTGQTINGTLYYYIQAQASPASLGRDQKGRDLYVINFDIVKEFE